MVVGALLGVGEGLGLGLGLAVLGLGGGGGGLGGAVAGGGAAALAVDSGDGEGCVEKEAGKFELTRAGSRWVGVGRCGRYRGGWQRGGATVDV